MTISRRAMMALPAAALLPLLPPPAFARPQPGAAVYFVDISPTAEALRRVTMTAEADGTFTIRPFPGVVPAWMNDNRLIPHVCEGWERAHEVADEMRRVLDRRLPDGPLTDVSMRLVGTGERIGAPMWVLGAFIIVEHEGRSGVSVADVDAEPVVAVEWPSLEEAVAAIREGRAAA